jgi:hypothetical protein
VFRNLTIGMIIIGCVFETAIAQAACVFLPGGDYVYAGDNQKTSQEMQLKQVVETCAAIVRKETNDKAGGFNVSQFDAYVEPDGTVNFFGTQREHFSFQKCMNERGHTLGPISGGR